MKVRLMTLRLAAACALAGILVAPLAAQTASNSTLTNTSTTGIQPMSDLLPVLVVFTGPANWDSVSSSAALGNAAGGAGSGRSYSVAPAPAAPATWGPATFSANAATASVVDSASARAFEQAPYSATASAPPAWPNFAPIAAAQPAPDAPAAAVSLPPPLWKR